MSFIPPTTQLNAERASAHAQEVEREAELKAERYAQLHPDGDHPVETRSERLLHRLFRRLSRGRSE